MIKDSKGWTENEIKLFDREDIEQSDEILISHLYVTEEQTMYISVFKKIKDNGVDVHQRIAFTKFAFLKQKNA